MRSAFIFTLALCLPRLGWAQSPYANPYTGTQFGNPTSAMLDTMISADIQRLGWQQWKRQDQAAPPAPVPPPVRPRRALALTDFHPAVPGHPTVDTFVAALNVDEGERAQLRSAVGVTFHALAKERKNNIATALAATVGLARSILQGHEMPDRAVARLRWSINDTLGRAPGFASMGAERKQALYEALVVETALLGLSWNAAQQNPDLAPAAQTLARQVLAQITGSTEP